MEKDYVSRRLWIFPPAIFLAFVVANPAAQIDPLAQVRTLTGQQQFKKAMQRLQQFLAENPDNLDAKLLRGVVLTRQGDIDAAISAFEQLTTEHPKLPEPHNNLAVLHASRGDYEPARLALLRAIELQPRYDTAHENLGDLYAKLASIEYEKALKLNPDNPRTAEKVRVLSTSIELHETESSAPADEAATTTPPTLASKDTEDGTEPKACYVIGRLLEEADAKRVRQWFGKRDLATRFTSRDENIPVGYRVYIPPLESTAATDVQITRMRTEGIEDIIRISGGDLDNGIALGVYATAAAAERRIASLETMGYRPEMAERSRRAAVWYVGAVLAPDHPSVVDFPDAFPGFRFREVSCQ